MPALKPRCGANPANDGEVGSATLSQAREVFPRHELRNALLRGRALARRGVLAPFREVDIDRNIAERSGLAPERDTLDIYSSRSGDWHTIRSDSAGP